MMSRARALAAASVVVLATCGHAKKPVVKGPVGPPPRDTTNDAAIIDAKVHGLLDGDSVGHVAIDVTDVSGTRTPAVDFLQLDDLRLIISASCLHDGSLDCDAFEAVKRITGVKVEVAAGLDVGDRDEQRVAVVAGDRHARAMLQAARGGIERRRAAAVAGRSQDRQPRQRPGHSLAQELASVHASHYHCGPTGQRAPNAHDTAPGPWIRRRIALSSRGPMEEALAPGTRLGRYEIVRRLATGGMAEIYLARMSGPSGFAKHVVLKRILPSYARDAEFVRMFHNEARYAATLDHPNIAQVYDLGEQHGLHYFTMEYLHGEDCRELIRIASNRRQPIPLEHALAIVIGAAAGCHHAHDMLGEDGRPLGLVHRDISPSNVVVTYAGAVKIVDFGIAKATNVEAVTAVGATKGKLSYMAPEQGKSQPVDRRADVYALGVLLYELTTLRRAFLGESEAQILWHVISGEWPLPSTVTPAYPPALEAIVERAMKLEREDRYATARELQQALEAFAQDAGLTLATGRLGELLDDLIGPKLEPWRTADRVESRPATPLPAEALADTAPGAAVATEDGARTPTRAELPPPSPFLAPTPLPTPFPTGTPAPVQSSSPGPSSAASSITAARPRPGSGRGIWLLAGVLATGGATAVGYVIYQGTRPSEPPVVMVAERGRAVVEQPDAGVVIARATVGPDAGTRPLALGRVPW